MTLHTKHVTDCCGAHIRCFSDCEGVSEGQCKDCGSDLCSGCAVTFEREDGYGEDGQEIHTTARCAECEESRIEFERITGRKWGADTAREVRS